jgi:alkylhydroperoxidase family enzyme
VSSPPSPRIAPLPREEWGDDERAALAAGFSEQIAARLLATGPDARPLPNVLGTLMRHPALAGPFLAYNNVLLFAPTLEPRIRELLILRVASRTRADYEWAQHVRMAAAAGVTDEEIEAVRDGAAGSAWSPLDAALLAAVDELVDGYRVTDDTWAGLAGHLDERQLMELVFVVGTYTALAMAFNTFGLELDPDLQAVATTSRPEHEE